MREILFRGKRVDNGEWIDGNLICNDDACFIAEKTKYSFIGYCAICNRPFDSTYEIRPETVCQYTGLTDKHGKKIFEGDIVINKAKWGDNIGVITFKNGRFVVDWKIYNKHSDKGITARTDDLSTCDEVVGNIFDNPELLTED